MTMPIAKTVSPKPRFRSVGRKDGLVIRVVGAIEGQILDGRLAVGTRLPPEREFSESLGVSRPVVREAVRVLVTKGLLETRHGQFIPDREPQAVSFPHGVRPCGRLGLGSALWLASLGCGHAQGLLPVCPAAQRQRDDT